MKNKFIIVLVVVIILLIILVILFWDDLIIKKQEIIEADYCEVAEDCVWAINPNYCCACPIPMNKEVVELDDEFVIYEEGVDYSDHEKREECSVGVCGVCAPVNKIVCVENKCESFQEEM